MKSNNKQEISKLLKHITEGEYAKANGNVKTIVEKKISDRISRINAKQK